MSQPEELSTEELVFINDTIDEAQRQLPDFIHQAEILFREGFGKSDSVEIKTDHDYVTRYDKDIQTRFVEWVAQRFPQHGRYGEEGESTVEDEKMPEWLWAIDPVDGTTNYLNGNPACSIVISLRYRGVPVFAVVDLPMLNEFYVARIGQGVTRNGEKVQPTSQTQLDKTLLVSTYLFDMKRMDEMIGQVWDHVAGVHLHYSSLQEVSEVVSGRVGIGVWHDLGPHEWPAAVLMAREAGCVIGNLQNLDTPISTKGMGNRSFVIAGNQSLFDQAKPFIHFPSQIS